MSKKKPADGPTAYTYRPAPDVRKALKAYLDAQKFDLPAAVVIDRAVREFLRNEGYDVAEKPPAEG